MPQLLQKFNDLKGHFSLQTESRQKRYRPRSSVKWTQPCQFILTGSLAWRWFFHFCHEFPQVVSTAKPLPANTQSSSHVIGIHLAEPEGGKAKHCNSEKHNHLATSEDDFQFRSCINIFHEPENQHDGMMPSARSINDYALQAIHVFPFRSCHWGLCVFSVFLDVVSEAHKYTCICHEGRNCPQACCEVRSLERQGLWVVLDVQLQMKITSS